MNKRWHDRHKMPLDATDREKLKWHQKHQKACGCRPIPKNLQLRLDGEVKTNPPKS